MILCSYLYRSINVYFFIYLEINNVEKSKIKSVMFLILFIMKVLNIKLEKLIDRDYYQPIF